MTVFMYLTQVLQDMLLQALILIYSLPFRMEVALAMAAAGFGLCSFG
jgi:hypothetical protein